MLYVLSIQSLHHAHVRASTWHDWCVLSPTYIKPPCFLWQPASVITTYRGSLLAAALVTLNCIQARDQSLPSKPVSNDITWRRQSQFVGGVIASKILPEILVLQYMYYNWYSCTTVRLLEEERGEKKYFTASQLPLSVTLISDWLGMHCIPATCSIASITSY